jgi:hypothetical protein
MSAPMAAPWAAADGAADFRADTRAYVSPAARIVAVRILPVVIRSANQASAVSDGWAIRHGANRPLGGQQQIDYLTPTRDSPAGETTKYTNHTKSEGHFDFRIRVIRVFRG